MTNIHLIVQLGDGCVIVGTLVSFQQNLPVPTFFDSAIHQLPEASCSVSVLTDTMGTLDFNARHVVNYPPPKGEWDSCLAIITESCLSAIGLHFGIGPCSGEACSRHSALFDEPIIKTTRAE